MNSGMGIIGYLLNPSKTMYVRINEIQKVIKDNFNKNFIINQNICAVFMKTDDIKNLYSFNKFIGKQYEVSNLMTRNEELLIRCSSKTVPTIIDIDIGTFTNKESSEFFRNKWLQLFNKQLIGLHFTVDNIQFINENYDVVESIITVESILNNIKAKSITSVVC